MVEYKIIERTDNEDVSVLYLNKDIEDKMISIDKDKCLNKWLETIGFDGCRCQEGKFLLVEDYNIRVTDNGTCIIYVASIIIKSFDIEQRTPRARGNRKRNTLR